LAFADQVPLVVREPVTAALGQFAPIAVRSSEPLTVMHDEVTFQLPTTLPPQAAGLEQAWPGVPELPPVPKAPALPVPAPWLAPPLLEPPPVPAAPEDEPELHATSAI